ncbi:MAG: hypothetical protein QXS83_03635, partial [Thermoplasmata archaeon]
FFVPEPVKIRIGLEGMKEIELQNHPLNKALGTRKLSVGNEVFLSGTDFKNYHGQEIRLKDFCNILCQENAVITSWENKNIPRIQWVPCNEAVEIEVIQIDGSSVMGVAERNLLSVNPGSVVQLERYGFVRIDERGEKIKGYFAHK